MEAEILFRVTKKPPGIDNGDGWLYNMVNGPDATIHLKMIKLVNCRLYRFYHIKKTDVVGDCWVTVSGVTFS